MKYLIVYAHPNPKSFCHAILEKTKSTLEAAGHEAVVRDLYELDFKPVLSGSDFKAFQSKQTPADIEIEQEHIRRSDVMIFIYPVWWTGMPAILKGYIDRVFSNGFAFSYGADGPVGLLKDKKAIILNTQGAPNEYYESNGMADAMKKTSDTGIFEFCGIKVLAHHFYGSVPMTTDEVRRGYLENVRKAAIA